MSDIDNVILFTPRAKPEPEPEIVPIRFRYTNYRGKVEVREVTAVEPFEFKSTRHHPEPQWFMRAWCTRRQDYRDFALRDCDFTAAEGRL